MRRSGRVATTRSTTRAAALVSAFVAASILALGLTGCRGSSAPVPDGSPPDRSNFTSSPDAGTNPDSDGPDDPDRVPEGTVIRIVPRDQWRAMIDAGMVRPECPVQKRNQLRRVDLDYLDFDGETQRGHLIVNRDVAETVARIFETLYDEQYPIEQMVSVETYDGDLNASLEANNTSAYNCRRPDQIQAPFAESPHANGRAIDINPVQNPWIDLRCDCWMPGPENKKRDDEPGKIRKGSLVWQLFTEAGWIWQNIDTPDYMHFDTGYPSAPYRDPGT